MALIYVGSEDRDKDALTYSSGGPSLYGLDVGWVQGQGQGRVLLCSTELSFLNGKEYKKFLDNIIK